MRYRHHNLVEEAPDRFDLVVCRNVLIYFQDAHLARAAQTLAGGVATGGWLLTGPAEARPELFPELQSVHLDDALLFCRPGAGFVAPVTRPAPPTSRSRFAAPPPAAGAPVPAPVTAAVPAVPDPGERAPDATLEVRLGRIRALADRGETDAAWAQVEAVAAQDALFPEVHLVRALVARARGDTAEALRSATAALFLDPSLALASVLSGDLLRAAGNLDGAARAYRNALAALATLAADTAVPYGDGLTAGALAGLAERALAEVGRARGGSAA